MTIDFSAFDPNAMLRRATQQSIRRLSGTVQGSVKHGMIHTESPDATVHHTIIAACPNPNRELADKGQFYMVGYVSIPVTWLSILNADLAGVYQISFIGPAGVIQKLPSVLSDMETVLGERVYLGISWLYTELPRQPNAEEIKTHFIELVRTLRKYYES